jgi:RNA polymerase sporulation-specific sigma factor
MVKDRNQAVEANLGLVHSCCKRFANRGIEYEELFSAGCLGLIKAIDKFDEGKGFMLSTYAVPVILGEIKQLFRDSGTVKVSRNLKDLAMKAHRLNDAYLKETGSELPLSELAVRLETEPEKIAEALNAVMTPVSLTSAEEHENGAEPELAIPVESVEELLTEKMSLAAVLQELPQEDKELIILRYFKHKTQQQTADLLKISQVQVSSKEKKILLKLREKLGG